MSKRAVLLLVSGLSSFTLRAADTSPPGELVQLRNSYEVEIARLTEPARLKYQEALKKLQENYTKGGQLDRALMVRDELQKIGYTAGPEKKPGATRNGLEGTEWLWGSGGNLKLDWNGKATHTKWAGPGTWKKIDKRTITIERQGNPSFTAVFSDDLTSAEVTTSIGGKTTLTRVGK